MGTTSYLMQTKALRGGLEPPKHLCATVWKIVIAMSNHNVNVSSHVDLCPDPFRKIVWARDIT